MKSIKFFYFWGFLASLCLLSLGAEAKLRVLTTLTDLASLTKEVGGDFVTVESIVKGTQDPHYIEAKPSFMTKASRADLIISIGLDLESAWLPSIIRGSRNPDINFGAKGFLQVGPLVDPIEILKGSFSRSEGDVHPEGNPHVSLDPIRAVKIAHLISQRLTELDSAHAETYKKNAKAFKERIEAKVKVWQQRIKASGVTSVVTYHKTLSYFLDRFDLKSLGMLEPKPGIPPTSRHIMSLTATLKKEPKALVLVENYFDSGVTKKIKQEIPALKVRPVAVAVGGGPKLKNLEDVYESLVIAIEGKDL